MDKQNTQWTKVYLSTLYPLMITETSKSYTQSWTLLVSNKTQKHSSSTWKQHMQSLQIIIQKHSNSKIIVNKDGLQRIVFVWINSKLMQLINIEIPITLRISIISCMVKKVLNLIILKVTRLLTDLVQVLFLIKSHHRVNMQLKKNQRMNR